MFSRRLRIAPCEIVEPLVHAFLLFAKLANGDNQILGLGSSAHDETNEAGPRCAFDLRWFIAELVHELIEYRFDRIETFAFRDAMWREPRE